MIFHYFSQPQNSSPLNVYGLSLGEWYRLIYPDLILLDLTKIQPGSIIFIWDIGLLSLLEHFEEWNSQVLWPEQSDKLVFIAPHRQFIRVLGHQILSFMKESTVFSIDNLLKYFHCEEISLSPSLSYLNNSFDIHTAIRAFQFQHYHKNGVTILDPSCFYIAGLPTIGARSVLHSGVIIEGNSSISEEVTIGPHCHLVNARIGAGSTLLTGTLVYDSEIEKEVVVGPYAHLRAQSIVKDKAKIGNYVEIKKSIIGEGSKAMHLSYLGDSVLGEKVNIGAGTITCNYDGVNKHPTHIGDRVFIGSGSELVAPVIIGDDAYVAAGSTITENVPENSLAIARMRQRIIHGWASRRKLKPGDVNAK